MEETTEREDKMPKKKKSSAYGIFVALSFALAFYVYYTTGNLFLAFLLVLLGGGIALSNR